VGIVGFADGGIRGALVGNALASLVGAALLFRIVSRGTERERADAPFGSVKLLRFALALGVHAALLSMVTKADVWAAKRAAVDGAEVGHYVAAVTLSGTLSMLLMVLSGTIMPFLAECLGKGETRRAAGYVGEATRLSLVLVGGAIGIGVPLASQILVLVFGEEFGGGGTVLALLFPAYGAIGVGQIWLAVVLAEGRTRVAIGILIVVLLFEAAGLVVLTGSHGGVGAAASLLIAGVTMMIAAGGVAMRRGVLRFELKSVVAIVVSSLVIGGGLALIDPVGWMVIPAAVLAPMLYAVMLTTMRVLRRDDFEVLLPWRSRA
jgi:O-antigen/teichoic acid export membrane protein